MRIVVVALFLSLYTLNGLGNTDSLLNELKKAPSDTSKINIYLKLVWLEKENNIKNTEYYLAKAIELANKTKLPKFIAHAHYYASIIDYYQSNFEQLERNTKIAREAYQKTNNEYGLISILNLVGLVQLQQAKYPEALKTFQEVYRLGEKINNLYSISNALNNIAMVYERTNSRDMALTTNYKALEIRRKIGDQAMIAESHLEIAISYYHLKNPDSAKNHLNQALAILKKHKSQRILGSVYNTFGTIHLDAKQHQNALNYFQMALNELKEVDDNHIKNAILINIVACQTNLGNFQESRQLLNAHLEKFQQEGDLRHLEMAFEEKSILAEKERKFEEALLAERMRLVYRDSLLNQERVDALTGLEVQFETEKKEKELVQKSLEFETQRNQLLKQRLWLVATATAAIIISLLGFLLFIRTRNKNKRIVQEILIQEQKRGLKSIIEATESERKKIARELHDSLAQQLAALNIGLARLQDTAGEKNEYISNLVTLAKSSSEEARNISHQLLPATLINLGLVPAVRELLEKSTKAAGFNYYLQAEDLPAISEQSSFAVYRVIQELLNNSLKHSGGDFIIVRLSQNEHEIQLIYEDNGKNFNPNKFTSGMGNLNIKSRLAVGDGKATFGRNEEGGIRASISLTMDGNVITSA